ncbi:hypothetical protein HW509_08100 [Asaia spathodeae]|uniref:hypothetical protein n=1 Tax=Asaia spathodeae TaxID=657016 RepID=UPI002FC39B0E
MTTTISGVWSAVLVNGKTVYHSGASVIDGPVSLGGNSPLLYVTSGAIVTGLTSPLSGYSAEWGSAIVQSGGTLQNSTLQTVVAIISSGGVLQDNTLNHTGDKIAAGGIVRNNVKYNGGDLSAAQGAQINNLSIS